MIMALAECAPGRCSSVTVGTIHTELAVFSKSKFYKIIRALNYSMVPLTSFSSWPFSNSILCVQKSLEKIRDNDSFNFKKHIWEVLVSSLYSVYIYVTTKKYMLVRLHCHHSFIYEPINWSM